jgi:hypothetical protein
MAAQDAALPEAPETCAVYDFDSASACVAWSAVGGAAAYAVEMRAVDIGSDVWTALSTTLSACRVRKKGLDPGSAYEFRAAAVDSAGRVGARSGSCVVPVRSGAAQQAAPTVSCVDGESATVAWAGDGPGPYALQIADEAAPSWKLVATVGGTSARKKNLEGGRAYAFRVKPADGDAYAWSRASAPARIPRAAPCMARCFGASLVGRTGPARKTGAALAGKIVAVYASASW